MFEWCVVSFAVFISITSAFYIVTFIYRGYLKKYYYAERKVLMDEFNLVGMRLNLKYLTVLIYISPAIKILLRIYRKKREREVENQLPGALILIANAIKAGLSLSQSIEVAADELKNPIRHEFELMVDSLHSGASVDQSLSIIGRRVRSKDVDIFVQSVEVLRRMGGNLIDTFALLADTIDSRRRVIRKNDAALAQGKYQSYMLLVMPWAIGFMLWFVAPDYIDPLINTRLGYFFIALGVFLETIGSMWMIKTVRINV
ncbi:MAG: hypothetical protein HN337_07375 [Deltaproteobacteria bacterium]|jgi:tight adherence protein B|nr:hypothetical protein [Deltaproteobacteria bacterium]